MRRNLLPVEPWDSFDLTDSRIEDFVLKHWINDVGMVLYLYACIVAV